MQYNVFISYRRNGGDAQARLIYVALKERGLAPFLDVETLGTGRFDEALIRAIADTPNFVVILGRESLDRCTAPDDWLRREISEAIRNGVNLVPLLLPGFSFPEADSLPEEIRGLPHYNAVHYDHVLFTAMVDRLASQLVRPTPERGADTHLQLSLTADEAQAGCKKFVSVQDARLVIKIRRGALSGQEITVPRRGGLGRYGGAPGDLRIELRVMPAPDAGTGTDPEGVPPAGSVSYASQRWFKLKRILFWLQMALILILGSGIGIAAGMFYQVNKMLPPDASLDHYRPPAVTSIVSSDGVVLARLAAEDRVPIPIERMPKTVQHALVAAEDPGFYQHSGVDFGKLAGSFSAGSEEVASNSSTISQKLARAMFLPSRVTLARRVKEIFLAAQIERNWTKDRILEGYLNQIYFGSRAYGIEVAAQSYFGKPAKRLTVAEAATLIAIAQKPRELNPYNVYREDGNYQLTEMARNEVLDRMVELKFITSDEGDRAKEGHIKLTQEPSRPRRFLKAEAFCLYVVDYLRNQLGYDEDLIEKAGLVIVTSLSWKMQQEAERAAQAGVHRLRGSGCEIDLVCLDPRTGYVRAMVGGVEQPVDPDKGGYATVRKRPVGAAYDLFAYATALEAGATPTTKIEGTTTLQTAFTSPSSGAFPGVWAKAGLARVEEMARRAGVKGRIQSNSGSPREAETILPVELASAMTLVSGGGRVTQPLPVVQIFGIDSEVLEDLQPKHTSVRLRPETVSGLEHLTRVAVKTGVARVASTVRGAHGALSVTPGRDSAWFVGYTPELAATVWCGHSIGRSSIPLPRPEPVRVWADYMKTAILINPSRK